MKRTLSLLWIFILLLAACHPAPVASPAGSATIAPATLSPLSPTPLSVTGSTPAPQPTPPAALDGLPIDQFFDESFKQIMLRDPEWVTSEGLASRFGIRNDQLTDVSDAYLHGTLALEQHILDRLHTYDRSQLSPQQQISYDTYAWYLDDLLRQAPYLYYDYPVNQLAALGVQYALEYLFTDLQPMLTLQDAQDYVARLSQVKRRMEQLVDGLKLRQQKGILPPRLIVDWTLPDLQATANQTPASSPFYTTFADKLGKIGGIQAAQRQALLADAKNQVSASVLPGYKLLLDYLTGIQNQAPAQDGVWQFANGPAYYQYALRHLTTTDMTPAEIHKLGLQELDRVHTEMRQVFDQLGYPKDASLSDLYNRVAQDGGIDNGQQILKDYQALIDQAGQRLDPAFDLKPKAGIKVVGVPQGGFYVQPSLDGSRPGVFYATFSGREPRYGMPTLAYHEGIPGHHLQIAIASEQNLPLFRNVIVFNAYAEGWALYAERLAYELGWYKDDPFGNLGRLQMEALRLARLVVDTGIHDQKWTFNQGVDFLVENTGESQGYSQFEVARYIAWPGQADCYYIGFLKILELRQKAQDALGAKFDLKEFHHVLLANGSMPLSVLEQVVEADIQRQK